MFDDEMLVGDRTTESIFHFFRNHVTSQAGKNRCEAVWEVISERHEPSKVIPRVIALARAALYTCFVFETERRRHSTRPRIQITVVSLEKLTGNAAVRDLYMRVDDGKLLYVEGYEDGSTPTSWNCANTPMHASRPSTREVSLALNRYRLVKSTYSPSVVHKIFSPPIQVLLSPVAFAIKRAK